MRLLDTRTHELVEVDYPRTPPYAILSHTWSENEITYQEFLNKQTTGKEESYEKINNAARVATSAGYNYLWIDTCCIDKTNHVEFSEAINSMYNWYKEAEHCFAYLSDAAPLASATTPELSISSCRWFTRGWTLQELLAPPEISFFAHDWTTVGSRTQLVNTISTITGIPNSFLMGQDLDQASVAQRMSWASGRQTKKAEDIAYCLLGIFNVQMPLLYGEREVGAFRRLQQEIMKDSDDHSIFAWKDDKSKTPWRRDAARQSFSLLAQSPAWFSASRTVVQAELPVISGYLDGIRTPTIFDNKGLHLTLPLIPQEGRRSLAVLGCSHQLVMGESFSAIWLQDVSTNGGRYIRVKRNEVAEISLSDIVTSAVFQDITIVKGDEKMLGEQWMQLEGTLVRASAEPGAELPLEFSDTMPPTPSRSPSPTPLLSLISYGRSDSWPKIRGSKAENDSERGLQSRRRNAVRYTRRQSREGPVNQVLGQLQNFLSDIVG